MDRKKTHLTIKVLYDNRKENPQMQEGFGFSCLIEWSEHKILFDSGGDKDVFFSNAKHLNIALDQITHAVFSHKHWDHRMGFQEILGQLKENTPVFLPVTFPQSLMNQAPQSVQLRQIDTFTEVAESCYSIVLKGGLFLYEQSLLIDTPKGIVIVTGCAHAGIVSIIEAAKEKLNRPVYSVIGGFHLHRSLKSTCTAIVRQFLEHGVQTVAPCHCAGERAIAQFEAAYGKNFFKVGTGSILNLF